MHCRNRSHAAISTLTTYLDEAETDPAVTETLQEIQHSPLSVGSGGQRAAQVLQGWCVCCTAEEQHLVRSSGSSCLRKLVQSA